MVKTSTCVKFIRHGELRKLTYLLQGAAIPSGNILDREKLGGKDLRMQQEGGSLLHFPLEQVETSVPLSRSGSGQEKLHVDPSYLMN